MKKLLALSCAILLLASCSNDDGGGLLQKEKRTIRFSSQLSLLKSTYDGTQIANGQKVGIFITEDAANPTVTYTPNIVYTGDGAGNLLGLTQNFPDNGNSIKISAYHPYNNGAEDSYLFSVATDQTDATAMYDSDLLYCTPFTQESTNGQIVLTFNHKLSQVKVKLISGKGSPSVKGAQVSVLSTATTVEFNRVDGSLGEVSNVQEVKLGDDGAGAIVPQTINSGTKFIKVTLDSGKELFYTLDQDLTLESGKEYTFELEVNLSDVASIGTGVDDWEPGETIDGDAGEDPASLAPGVEYMTDTRDGKEEKYLTGDFGTAGRWFLENLRYLPANNSIALSTSADDNATKSYFYPNGTAANTYGNPPANWTPQMGLLYTWLAATNGENTSFEDQRGVNHQKYQGLCPEGWHVPSDYEWTQLITEVMDNHSKYTIVEPAGESWALLSQTVGRGQSKPATQGGFDVLFVASMAKGAGPDNQNSASLWTSSSAKLNASDQGSAVARYIPNYLSSEPIGSSQEGRVRLNSVRCKKN